MNMSTKNSRVLLRLWIPAIVLFVIVGGLIVAGLTSGDLGRSVPAAVGVTVAAIVIIAMRWQQRRRIGRMLHAADPHPFLRAVAASAGRMPHGTFIAAASGATMLALYGRFDEAEQSLASVAWGDVPSMILAQESAARAAIAYARGAYTEGLDHAVLAMQQGAIDPAFPGAQTSELALRTYRNLGLALLGRTLETTPDELRTAFARLPMMGQILAAWGLAMIAKTSGAAEEVRAMRDFITQRAPHFSPVLASING